MITTQRELRRRFWQDNPGLNHRKVADYSNEVTMYVTDTRCAWLDWLDMMDRDGQLADGLADRATLD